MGEEWRVTVTLREHGLGRRLLDWLHEHEVEDEARERLGGRVAVSGGDPHVFLYARSEEAAREAEQVVRELVGARGLEADYSLERWHRLEERWEDAAVPLPQTAAERRAEHERLIAQETAESQASGYAQWEVRLELASHGETVALADRLQAEGMSVIRRWRHLLLGVNNRDEAHALAQRLEQEAPPGTQVQVEPGGGVVWEIMPRNPFAVFGGLGS